MIAKLNSCAMATPTTNPGVVSYPNMTETRTKDQMRKPREKSSQVATSSFDSSLAPTIRRMLARAYLRKKGKGIVVFQPPFSRYLFSFCGHFREETFAFLIELWNHLKRKGGERRGD